MIILVITIIAMPERFYSVFNHGYDLMPLLSILAF